MGWLPKNETIKILVVCCMGLAPSVSNRQGAQPIQQTTKVMMDPRSPKHESVKTLIVACSMRHSPLRHETVKTLTVVCCMGWAPSVQQPTKTLVVSDGLSGLDHRTRSKLWTNTSLMVPNPYSRQSKVMKVSYFVSSLSRSEHNHIVWQS